MDKERAAYLLNRYHSGACTPEEHAEFALLLHHPRFEALRNELLDGHWPREADGDWQQATPAGYWSVLAAIKAVPRGIRPRSLRRWLPYVAAAVAVLVAVGWLLLGDLRQQPSETGLAVTEILPGGNRATLTLADGRSIDLDEVQAGIRVDADDITYADGASLGLPPSEELVLTTPRGGTYQVTLSDGSNVWLNANSTLKYPSRFQGDERVVELTGEAYFDVEKGEAPFRVLSKGQTVEVLGTQFNISAYADEPETKTTLVEGKVRLRAGDTDASVSLVPGEQGTLTASSLTKQHVDVQQYTAWKDGYFAFNNTPIDAVMKQLGRWYDIEVRYEGTIPTDRFDGEISRELTLQQVLNGLATTQINYRVEGNTLTIMNHTTPN